MRQPGHRLVYIDRRAKDCWRLLLTASRSQMVDYCEAQINDPVHAELMHMAFIDACLDLEGFAAEYGVIFGDDISVPGVAGTGFLQMKRRLEQPPEPEQEIALEAEFGRLLREHFARIERRPGNALM